MSIDISPITQDAKSLIILNYNLNTPEQYRINDTDFVFDAPVVNANVAYVQNTELMVRPTAASGKYGRVTIYYDRINLSTFVNRPTMDLTAMTSVEIVGHVNDWYGINLTPSDYTTVGEGETLQIIAKPESLMFVGAMYLLNLILAEDGSPLMTEDGGYLVMETP